MKQELYYIAVIPNEEVTTLIRKVKEELLQNYGLKHALKSPAHITLQRPFKRMPAEEPRLFQQLMQFAAQQEAFEIALSGYASFAPKVIYAAIADHEPVKELYDNLYTCLLEAIGFEISELSTDFHPHMTVATRDVTETVFDKLWPQFKERSLSGTFTVDSIAVLKHNGKHWNVYKRFPFKNSISV